MPTDKAHGIQIAKMCEVFAGAGAPLELVVPSRGRGSLKSAYDLTVDLSLRRLPVFDFQFLGPLGYRLTALQFICGVLFYLWSKVLLGESFVVYTVDMDNFSFVPLMLIPRPVFAEMHSKKQSNLLTRFFFNRANIIATNSLIADDLARTFDLPPSRLCIEPNGVDTAVLQNALSTTEARACLNLPDNPFVLYVGRFYAWKGLEILADVVGSSPLPIYLVGGTREEYERVTKKSGAELHFFGVRPVNEIPLWLAAADMLLVLGTKENESSYRYTSPMKIFEYLAARRPVIASQTPANASIITEDAVFWYSPDDVLSLAQALQNVQTSKDVVARTQIGRTLAEQHTWDARARRILAFMAPVDTLSK